MRLFFFLYLQFSTLLFFFSVPFAPNCNNVHKKEEKQATGKIQMGIN